MYTLKDGGAWARLVLDSPRDELPPEVRTTEVGVNTSDANAAGVIVYDPAFASLHVLSRSGYLLRVEGPGDTTEAQRLAMALAKSVRQRLSQPPPTLSLNGTEVSGRDLCESVRQVGLVSTLGLQETIHSSVDGRVCDVPKRFMVSFFGQHGFPSPGPEAETVRIGPATAELRAGPCEVVIPIHPAPTQGRWAYDSVLARSDQDTGPACDRFIASLAPLVELLAKTP